MFADPRCSQPHPVCVPENTSSIFLLGGACSASVCVVVQSEARNNKNEFSEEEESLWTPLHPPPKRPMCENSLFGSNLSVHSPEMNKKQ